MLNKTIILSVFLMLSTAIGFAQDTMYVHQTGGLLTKIPIASIDSAVFYNPSSNTDTMFVQQAGGGEPSKIAINQIDSVVFYNAKNVLGFDVLDKLKGIWNGPVTSTTALGGYPEWIVDFRPISENQISAKNELDTLNDIHMTFFIAKYKNNFGVVFRNGGAFTGLQRVSYFMADSVSQQGGESFYRFSEMVKGKKRAYTTLLFKGDSLIMRTYTNVYNTQSSATPHMTWKAELQDLTSCQDAVANFNFPKKTLTKDFSSTFVGQSEAVFYSSSGPPVADPYTENMQPYLGKTTVNYTYSGVLVPNSSKKVFIMITTQPLIDGFTINSASMKTRSRYVVLSANDQSFTFNYMHSGSYYLYALYDNDGNGIFSSGDWVSTTNTNFTLSNQGTANISTEINFTIP